MELFTEEEIEDRWARALSLDEAESADSWRRFREEQPGLFAYLTERAESRFAPDVGELLLSTVAILWVVFSEEEEIEQEINQQLLAGLEHRNGPLLEWLSDEEPLRHSFQERFDVLLNQLDDMLDQPHLFQLAFERIDDAHEDRNPDFDDFAFALLLFYLKIVIDALDGEF
ncbi:MAG: hypothetical protein AAF585_12515 [Verrucomicrobiota bacterium]